jgi:SAM-dependent methyltransferase
MIKKSVQHLLRVVADRVIFPLSRWHRSNAFLYERHLWGESTPDDPSCLWLAIGLLGYKCQKAAELVRGYYLDAVINNYSVLLKKHYVENYAYQNVINNEAYVREFNGTRGTIKDLFENPTLLGALKVTGHDSFLDCGCGPGRNIREILHYLPEARVEGFDISRAAIEFADEHFKGQNVVASRASVLDWGLYQKYQNGSVDNVLFANMFATIYDKSVTETRKIRQRIIDEAVRISGKNVILSEYIVPENIFIEQKYRAIFQEDYSRYFEKHSRAGDLVFGKNMLIFHKK